MDARTSQSQPILAIMGHLIDHVRAAPSLRMACEGAVAIGQEITSSGGTINMGRSPVHPWGAFSMAAPVSDPKSPNYRHHASFWAGRVYDSCWLAWRGWDSLQAHLVDIVAKGAKIHVLSVECDGF